MPQKFGSHFRESIVGLSVILVLALSCALPGTGENEETAVAQAGGESGISLNAASTPDIETGSFSYSQKAVYAKLTNMKVQLFDGKDADYTDNPYSKWTADQLAIYYKTPDGKYAYIYNKEEDDVRSEGMSYGMMIAVQMNLKTQFDLLWKFAKTYMWHTEERNLHTS